MGNALLFNAKFGIPEGALFAESPGIDLGIFNAGVKDHVTDMDIGDLIVGKTIPYVGRIHVAGYLGNADSALMHEGGDLANAKKNYGYMVAFDQGFMTVKNKEGNEYSKIVVAADYASRRNFIGGDGFGVYYYFTKDISILSGPVWFNDHKIDGQWKWTTQLDVNY